MFILCVQEKLKKCYQLMESEETLGGQFLKHYRCKNVQQPVVTPETRTVWFSHPQTCQASDQDDKSAADVNATER